MGSRTTVRSPLKLTMSSPISSTADWGTRIGAKTTEYTSREGRMDLIVLQSHRTDIQEHTDLWLQCT